MNNVKIDLELDHSSDAIKESIFSLSKSIGLKRKEQTNTLKIILLNFVYFDFRALITPRAKQRLAPRRSNPLGIGAKSLITVLDALINEGLITQNLGFKDLAKNTGTSTSIEPADTLISFLCEHGFRKDVIHRARNAECLLLRNSKSVQGNKYLKDYTDSYRTNMMRVELVKYNSLLSETDIRVLADDHASEMDFNSQFVTRKFTDFGLHDPEGSELFAFGGRMYAEWCNLSKVQRSRLALNGDECVELDYPASHVNVMYKHLTGDWYQGDDPYELEVDGVGIPRHLVKKLSSIMLNVSSESAATKSLQSAYIKKGQGIEDLEGDTEGEDYIRAVDAVGIRSIIRAYLEKHSVIADFFLRDKQTGAYIQFLESELVMDVVNRLTLKGIPCLTIYDSFIVQRQYRETLQDFMNTAGFPNRLP